MNSSLADEKGELRSPWQAEACPTSDRTSFFAPRRFSRATEVVFLCVLCDSARDCFHRNRRLFVTTVTLDAAMAAEASMGDSSPSAATGMPTVL